MLNVEAVEIFANKSSDGPVVIEFSEFEGFNRIGVQMSKTMLACLEMQVKRCVNDLAIDRKKVKAEILVLEED